MLRPIVGSALGPIAFCSDRDRIERGAKTLEGTLDAPTSKKSWNAYCSALDSPIGARAWAGRETTRERALEAAFRSLSFGARRFSSRAEPTTGGPVLFRTPAARPSVRAVPAVPRRAR